MTEVRSHGDVLTASRIVVKVGSSSISGANAHQIAPLVDALAAAWGRGTEVVLACAERRGVSRFLHCSTESILFPYSRLGAVPAEEALQPADVMPGAYTRSKSLAELARLREANSERVMERDVLGARRRPSGQARDGQQAAPRDARISHTSYVHRITRLGCARPATMVAEPARPHRLAGEETRHPDDGHAARRRA